MAIIRRFLAGAFFLIALSALGANPSFNDFLGTNGIRVRILGTAPLQTVQIGITNVLGETNAFYLLLEGTNSLPNGFKLVPDGITLSYITNGQTVVITNSASGAGEVNTSSNVGDGVGVAAPKAGVNLPFKSFKSADGLATWTTNATNITLTININTNAFQPGSTTLTNLSGTGAITNLQAAVGIQLGTNAGIIYITNLVTALAETNWTNDAGVLRPISAGIINGTNASFWEKLIAKSAFITEDRARTLALGTNVVQALTNSFLLLDSPTSDATLVIVELTAASSSGQWLLLLNNQTNRGFSIFDGSGTGTGIVDLQGDFVTTNKGRGLLLVHNGVTWNEIGRFDSGGSAPEVEGSGIVTFLPIWVTTNTLGTSLIRQITNSPFEPPFFSPARTLIYADGIFKPAATIQQTSVGVVSSDNIQFDFTGFLFYRLVVTNNAATNRTFKLGNWIRSYESNDVAEVLIEWNGGTSLTFSNTGNAFLLTNWAPTAAGDRIKLNWNNLQTKWEEQWRYPPITTNAVGGSGTVTSVGLAEISSGDDLFEITGSPVTTSGTLSFAMTNEFLTNWAKVSTNVLAANKSPFTNDSGIVTYLLQNTNVFRFYQTNGSLYIGSNTLAALGVPYPANAYAVASVRNTQLGEVNLNGFFLETRNGSTRGTLDLVARSNNASFEVSKIPGPYKHIFTSSADGVDYVMRATNAFPMVEFLPTIPSGTVPYKFDTEFYHTSGYLLTVGNSNTAVFKVPYAVVKGALTNDGAGGWGYYDLAGITGSGAMRSVSTNGIIVSSPVTNVNFVTPLGSNIRITGIDDTGNALLDFTLSSTVLNNIAGTGAVTNVVSLSTSNAVSKPLTNSYTAGVVAFRGFEAGANVSITANESNYVLSASGSPSSLTVASNGTIFATGVTNVNFINVTTITNADGDVSIDPLGLVGEIWFQSGNAIFPRHYTNSNGRLALGTNTISSSAYLRIDNSDVTVPYAVFTANDIERSRIDSNGVFSVTGTSEGFSLQGNSIYSISNVSGLILTTNGPLLGIAIPQSATNIVWTNTLFVSPSGNDSTAQRNNPNRPWKRIFNAVSNALRGDVVFLYPGTFTEAGAEIRLTNGVSLVGSGRTASKIIYTADLTGEGPMIQPGDNTIVANLSCLLDPSFLEAQAAAAFGMGVLVDGVPATNVTVINCDFSGSTDCVYFDLAGALDDSVIQVDFHDCKFTSRWDLMALFEGNEDSRVNFYGCSFYADYVGNTWTDGTEMSVCNCTGGGVGFFANHIQLVGNPINTEGPYAIRSSSSGLAVSTRTNDIWLSGNFFDIRGTNSYDVQADNFGTVRIQQSMSYNRITTMTDGIVIFTETNKFLTHITSTNGVTTKWPTTNNLNGQVFTADGSGNGYWSTVSGSGTVTSVGLSSDDALFAVSGSPVTTSGTLGIILTNQFLTNWAKFSTNVINERQWGATSLTNLSLLRRSYTNYVFVRTNGNDATAVANRVDLPAATLTNAVALAAAGFFDIIVYEGVYTDNAVYLNIPPNVNLIGINYPIINSSCRLLFEGASVNPGHNTTIEGFVITNSLEDTEFSANIGYDDAVGQKLATNWTVRGCYLKGGTDCIYLASTSPTTNISFTLDRNIMEFDWDGLAMFHTNAQWRIVNNTFFGHGPSPVDTGQATKAMSLRGEGEVNGNLVVITSSVANAIGILVSVFATNSIVNACGNRFQITSTTATNIHVNGNSTLNMCESWSGGSGVYLPPHVNLLLPSTNKVGMLTNNALGQSGWFPIPTTVAPLTMQSNGTFISSAPVTNINLINSPEIQFLSTNASGNVSAQPVLRYLPLHKAANAVGTFSTNFFDASLNKVQVFTNGLMTNMVCILTNITAADSLTIDFYGSASEGRTNACTVQFLAPASPAGFVYRWPLGATNGNYEFLLNSNQFCSVELHFPRSTNVWGSYRIFGNE